MQAIAVEHAFAAAPERVFAVLSDHEGFSPAPRYRCRLLRPGNNQRNGDGALREVRKGAWRFVEGISRFQPGHGFDYHVQRLTWFGLPVPFRHQRGWLEIHPTGAGCRVIWRSRFSLALPVLGVALERQFAHTATRAFAWLLRQAAERLPGP